MEKSRSLSITPCTRVGVLTVYGFAMSKFPLAVLGELLYMPESSISRATNSPYPPIRSIAIAMRTTQCIGNVKVWVFDTRENHADIVTPLVLSVCSGTNRVLDDSHATRKSSW